MVKHRRWHFIAFLLNLSLSSSCSIVKGMWGETPPNQATISQNSNETTCRDLKEILEGSEKNSHETLNCWISKTDPLWNDIEGARKDELSESEISVLIKEGLLELDGNLDDHIKKLFGVKKLLGINGPVKHSEFSSWVGWVKSNRASIRLLYQKLDNPRIYLHFKDMKEIAVIGVSLLEKINWKMEISELGDTIQDVAHFRDPYIVNAVDVFVKVAAETLGMVCPTIKRRSRISTTEIADCITRGVSHFSVGEKWFEYAFNPVDQKDFKAWPINAALLRMEPRVENWFRQPQLKSFRTAIWLELSEALGAELPVDFLDKLKWIREISNTSTEKAIHPTSMITLFGMLKTFQERILDGMRSFLEAMDFDKCVHPASYWTSCVLPVDPNYDPNKDYSDFTMTEEVALALRVSNTHYGRNVQPFNGQRFSSIMLFHGAAEEIIKLFDKEPRDGVISTDIRNENDEIGRVLDFGVSFLNNTYRLYYNIRDRLYGLPVRPDVEPVSFKGIELKGLAKLITAAGDIFGLRSTEEAHLLDEIIGFIPGDFKKGKVHLDHASTTSVLLVADSITKYRDEYLGLTYDDMGNPKHSSEPYFDVTLDPVNGKHMVNRASVIRGLPKILKDFFPRIHQSCEAFGYQRSCHAAFDELIPGIPGISIEIPPADLDVITLAGAGLESLLDTCDRNRDGKLKWKLISGHDELDCTLKRLKVIITRLIESKIIFKDDDDEKDRKNTKFFLNLINSNFVSRGYGKAALVSGTNKGAVLRLVPQWLLGKTATFGSILSLLADSTVPDERRDWDNDKILEDWVENAPQNSSHR